MLSVSMLRAALIAVFATTAKGDRNGELFVKAARQFVEPHGLVGACQKPTVENLTSTEDCAALCLTTACLRFSFNGGTNQCHISVTGELYKRETGADVYERQGTPQCEISDAVEFYDLHIPDQVVLLMYYDAVRAT